MDGPESLIEHGLKIIRPWSFIRLHLKDDTLDFIFQNWALQPLVVFVRNPCYIL